MNDKTAADKTAAVMLFRFNNDSICGEYIEVEVCARILSAEVICFVVRECIYVIKKVWRTDIESVSHT